VSVDAIIPGAVGADAPARDLNDSDRRLITESLAAGQAWEYAAALCNGSKHRFAGSTGEAAAARYLALTLGEIGLSCVAREAFQIQGWQRGVAQLDVLSPELQRLHPLALAGTASAAVEGELSDAGYGTEEEFAALGEMTRGRLVLVRNGWPAWLKRPMHRGEKTIRAGRYGASALIIMNMEPGLLPLVGAHGFAEAIRPPAAAVSYEEGWLLASAAERGATRVRLSIQNLSRPASSQNVMAKLRGQAWPDRYLLLGAHYDSHDIAPGAVDNAGGVAVMVEAMRLLSHVGLGRSVRVVAFGAEEVGLLGSEAYVMQHAAELDGIDLMLNLDCAGGPGAKEMALDDWPELWTALRAPLAGVPDMSLTNWTPSIHSDHYPFMIAGVPTAELTGGQPYVLGRFTHTAADTLDKLNRLDLQAEALRVARTVARLSWVAPWTGRRRTPDQVRGVLTRAGLVDQLAQEGRYPFGRTQEQSASGNAR